MCEVLDVSRQGYYDWRGREPSRRQQKNEELLEDIERIFEHSRQTYGSPRIHRTLQDEGRTAGRNRVARIMRTNGIRAVQPRRKKRTTDSNHAFPIAKNLVDRNFEAITANEVWLTDITYIETDEGWLYLAAVLDVYSRKVVGWAMDKTMSRKLCMDALEMAIINRTPPEGLVHYSDRGSQYASGDYQKMLDDHGMICSMSRKGDCWDNAPMESFFGTLKTESLHRLGFATRNQARRVVFEYIEIFYNQKRKHSALDYASPVGFEETAKAA
jgi:transposase InsO family protein